MVPRKESVMILIFFAIWMIWKWRCSAIFEPNFRYPLVPAGTFKLNTDGNGEVISGNFRAGDVLCDSNNDWIKGFVAFLGCGSPLEAKLWGIFHGIRMAKRKGLDQLQVKSNSREAMELLRSINERHKLGNLCLTIKEMKASFPDFSFSSIYREQNQVANWLAKKRVRSKLGCSFLSEMSEDVLLLINQNKNNVVFDRMVRD